MRVILIAAMLAGAALGQDAAGLLPIVMGGEIAWTPYTLNPTAWWRADNNAVDSMGTYDGTWTGTELYATGKTGNAFDLWGNSSNSWINTAYPSTGDVFSAAGWINVRAMPTDSLIGAPIVHTFRDNYNVRYAVGISSSAKCGFVVINGGGSAVTVLGGTVAENTWYHIALTYDGTTARGYCDGTEFASTNTTIIAGSATKRLQIGGRSSGNSIVNGQLDDVVLWKSALSATDIARLYLETISLNGSEWQDE